MNASLLIRQLLVPALVTTLLYGALRGAWNGRERRKIHVWFLPLLAVPALFLFWRARPPDWLGLAREGLFLCLFAAINGFIGWRIDRSFPSRRIWMVPAVILSLLFASLYLRGMQIWPLGVGIWAGALFITAPLLVLEWLLTSRFPRLQRFWTTSLLLLTGLLVLIGFFHSRRIPTVADVSLPVSDLPEKAAGFTITHISDLHLGDVLPTSWLRRTCDQVNRLRSDLIVITGDLFSRTPDPEQLAILGMLRAPAGVWMVPGNHEFYLDIDRSRRLAAEAGITLLHNQRIELACGIQLAGLDDPAAERFGRGKPDARTFLNGADPRRPLILLHHRPDTKIWRGQGRVDLQLSGHTHGGQFPPLTFWVWMRIGHLYGLRHRDGAWVYTSPGTGVWAIPLRLFSRNEITRITLKTNSQLP